MQHLAGGMFMSVIKVAVLGTGFISNIHMESFQRFVRGAEVVAVWNPNPEHAKQFAEQHKIAQYYSDIDALLRESGCDVVDICLPNYLHHTYCLKAIEAGKHVIVEKPFCVSLREADEMLAAAREKGVTLFYAEQLCFAPKYERVRALINAGAVGDVYMLKQAERHSGPHTPWFYDVHRSGGGCVLDLACHGFGWFKWMLGEGCRIKSVQANLSTVYHNEITQGEDNAVVILEYETADGKTVTCLSETSWAKPGGMDDRIEVYGTKGVTYADLFQGNAALTYSTEGYDYAMEKAELSTGWTFTIYEEAFNQGYPQELQHFIDCIRDGSQPVFSAQNGRDVMEAVYAVYESARTGKKVELPFTSDAELPISLWKAIHSS